MLAILLVVLIILFFLGYIHIGNLTIPDITLFSLNGRPITLWNILILLVISWALSILPSPLREIAGVLLVLWILSVLGIIAVAGFSQIIVIAIIVGIILALLGVG